MRHHPTVVYFNLMLLTGMAIVLSSAQTEPPLPPGRPSGSGSFPLPPQGGSGSLPPPPQGGSGQPSGSGSLPLPPQGGSGSLPPPRSGQPSGSGSFPLPPQGGSGSLPLPRSGQPSGSGSLPPPPQDGSGSGQPSGLPPNGGGGGAGQPQLADGESAMPGMIGRGEAATCNGTTPCACPLLGDVGLTTVNGTNAAGLVLPIGENIYGPFEAGFSSQQDNILGQLGCATGKGYVAGGIDTKTAEAVVAKDCGIILPRTSPNNVYISLLDKCGGHTTEYHFHERLSCLYKLEGTHSTKVGEDVQFNKSIYGKWEDYSTNTRPNLDACGGHFGYTPESPATKVYHYHLQDEAPFTLGCFGPNAQNQEVTMAECRALYAGCNTASGIIDVVTYNGTSQYQTWCPCFFTGPGGNNSNVILSTSVAAPSITTAAPVLSTTTYTPQPTATSTSQPVVTVTTTTAVPATTAATVGTTTSPQPTAVTTGSSAASSGSGIVVSNDTDVAATGGGAAAAAAASEDDAAVPTWGVVVIALSAVALVAVAALFTLKYASSERSSSGSHNEEDNDGGGGVSEMDFKVVPLLGSPPQINKCSTGDIVLD